MSDACRALCLITIALVVTSRPAYGQGGWIVTDLGTLGGLFGDAEDINEAGHVVGSASPASGSDHAFRWTPSTGMVDLGR